MNINQKGFLNVALIVSVVILAGVAGYFALNNRSTAPTPMPLIGEQPTPPIPSTPSPTPTPSPKPTPTPTPSISLLRVCPEEWYDNRMPSTVGSSDVPREYFIYKGVRRELSEFDVNWVKTNCSVKPQAVY